MLMMFVFCILNYIALKRNEFLYNGIYSCCMGLIMMSYAWFYNNPAVWAGEFFSHWWLVLLNVGYIFTSSSPGNSWIRRGSSLPQQTVPFPDRHSYLPIITLHCPLFFRQRFWSYALQNAMKINQWASALSILSWSLENKNRLMNYLSIGCAVQVICSPHRPGACSDQCRLTQPAHFFPVLF